MASPEDRVYEWRDLMEKFQMLMFHDLLLTG